MEHWELLLIFLIIAFVYSSVGFGVGSCYLAVLSLYCLPYQVISLTALICNVIVVVGGVIIYLRNKQVDWQKILPLILVSVPMDYLGSIIKLSQETFCLILGFTLILASLLLLIQTDKMDKDYRTENYKPSLVQ